MVDDPCMEAIKMQVDFDARFPVQSEYLHREKVDRAMMCAPTLREILDTHARNITSFEQLYKKIVAYVLLRSRCGTATDTRVVREATAALESVFPQSGLNPFVALSAGEKELQLNALANLVTGIRLYNRQLGRGGESIDDLPALCVAELVESARLVEEHTSSCESAIQRLTGTYHSSVANK
jgi:hypothetical protein